MTPTTEGTIERLERRLAVLEAREAIRDVLYLYARGADRADAELFKSCYHPDAIDCHWFWNGNAHEFADWVMPLLRQLPNSQHSITNPVIELDGDRAFVESQWYVLHRVPLDEERFVDQQVEGRYLDVFERRGGAWKILHRRARIAGTPGHRGPIRVVVIRSGHQVSRGGADRALPGDSHLLHGPVLHRVQR